MIISTILVLLFGITRHTYAVDLAASISYLDQNNSPNPRSLLYYWSPTQFPNQPRTLNIRISLEVEEQPDLNIQLSQAAQVRIDCTQNPTSDTSYALMTFTQSTQTLSSSVNAAIEFTIQRNGLSPLISCTGTVVSFTNQIVSNVQLTYLFFKIPSHILLTISDYPTISFNTNQQPVTNLQISPFTDSFFTIFFRDANLYDSTVSCSITPANSAIQFPQSSVTGAKGVNQININYALNSNTVQFASTSTITCTAQSTGVTGVNQQYQPSIAIATANVAFQSPQIDLLNPSGQFRYYGSNFGIPLKLNPNPIANSIVTIQCGLARFDSLDALNTYQNSIPANSCPSSLTAAPTPSNLNQNSYSSDSFDWYFVDPSNSSIQQTLRNYLYEIGQQNEIVIEQRPFTQIKTSFFVYLSLICCDVASLTSSPTAYSGIRSRLIINVPADQNPRLELPKTPSNDDLLNPAYDPCTCDLTVGLCDIGCCCDPGCSAADKRAFGFVCPVRQRTVFEKSIDRWSCYDIFNKPKLIEEDWFPILCIQFNFTYILGTYYSPNELDAFISNNNNEFLALIRSSFTQSYNYKSSLTNDPTSNTGVAPVCTLNTVSSYSYGQCLIEVDANGISTDFLRFPIASNSLSSCIFNTPIRFLSSDSSIFCQIDVDASICNAQTSQLNYNSFVNKVFLSNPSNPADQIQINIVEYYQCPNFLASSINIQPTNAPLNKCNYNFATNTRLFDNLPDAAACDSDTWTAPGGGDTSETSKIPNKYYQEAFLSGCTRLTNVPQVTSQAGRCANVLAGVRYVFLWQGGSVQKVVARVILTDAVYDPTTLSFPLKQLYQIEWNYNNVVFDDVVNVQGYDNVINSLTYYGNLRSGTLGYLMGRPIISGYKSNTNVDVDISNNLRISTQKLLNGALCGTLGLSEREIIKFGYNTSSSCVVQLGRVDLSSEAGCTNLKRIIFQKLNSYYAPSNFVSKNGNPNREGFVETDWVNVFPTVRTYIDEASESELDFTLNTCKNVPYRINVWFFYRTFGRINQQEVFEIEGVYVSYSLTDWSYVCKLSQVECATSVNPPLQDFNLEFQSYFVRTEKPDLSWADKCRLEKYPGWSCLQEVFWIWPRDYASDDFFYLYQLNLGVLFGIFGFVIFYVMLIGFTCPC